MVTRRNIRVKVMQTLYSQQTLDNELSVPEAINILKKNIEQSKHLFTYIIFFIAEIAKYAEIDARQKSNKHLPDYNDLNISTKIAENKVIAKILQNKSFTKILTEYNLMHRVDKELVKKIYNSLANSDRYQEYIHAPSVDKNSERKILEFIFNDLMLVNEDFINHLQDNFPNWDDDGDIIILLVTALFQKPEAMNFDEIVTSEKWQFAKDLLACVNDKKNYCLELIKPKLKNWDSERIATLDMILMQMGLCELLYFETIPPKVTINEYIDLAKEYSTPQSGNFVNGILDNIHKELMAENKIQKKNFKNSTL